MKLTKTIICLSIAISLNAYGQTNSWIEFMGGKRATYTTTGNPKAKGLEVSIDYPISWNGANGVQPNTLYQMTSENGRGLELCNLSIKEIPLPAGYLVTAHDVSELFEPSNLKSLAPNGALFIAGAKTTIDGQQAGWLLFSQEMNRAGIQLRMMSLTYTIYFDKKLIIFGCGVGDRASKSTEELQRRYKEYFPLFQEMAKNLVIHRPHKAQ